VTPNSHPSGRPARASRAWRFASSELHALRDVRRRVGIRRALVERIKWNLELDGVDGAAMSALAARLEATRAEFVAALAQSERELGAARETLATYARLTDTIAAHIELHEPATPHVAGPAMLERLLALGYWLAEQPPSELPVSVIIPTRSRPALVREAIASVQAQSHVQWEAIVVDDGSVDDTRATLAAIDDDRVRCLRTDGLGSAGARNAGLQFASGQAIAYLDDDNIMLPGWLAAVAWAFSRFDDVDVLYGARVVEDETPSTATRGCRGCSSATSTATACSSAATSTQT
jgi:Glycosyl transferase family 2